MFADARTHIDDFAEFITSSPSSYHAAAEVAQRLDAAGFTRMDERRPWDRCRGGQYVVRDGAVIAWLVPDVVDDTTGFRIVGSHTDSPGFKLKPLPDSSTVGWHQVGMEVYGGPLLNSWLDREFGLAGRLVTRDGEQRLVQTGPLLRIAQVAPHLDRSVNDNLHLDKQQHLLPLWAVGERPQSILDLLCEIAGIEPSDLGFHDVMAFTTQQPARFGHGERLFAAPRMDNQSSVHASLTALTDVTLGDDIAVLAAFDHEEVGSSTRSGACGPFLEDVLARIAASRDLTGDRFRAMIARSSCISADAGHAVHPNYVHLHDPDTRPLVNNGPLLKINGNQRYATDAVGGALWVRACEAAEVPTQPFVSNNAVPCGSTIGPLTATRLGITTVDVGIPLLSMHSAREMCGVDDPWFLSRALEAYWQGA
ncbi:M18 family aminopeptidase [Aestuariimicrobium ganziense]|uniref:M18 family aminopeptidase n=1 Tax=Aestuariimicrobium ganziense TaxID=2773677 RepID=UPI001942B4D4|nr:M18 family aminopeptidase [Aestuariimicrobium ganziense]